MAKSWAPDSWRSFPIKQQPAWPDEADLDRALKQSPNTGTLSLTYERYGAQNNALGH